MGDFIGIYDRTTPDNVYTREVLTEKTKDFTGIWMEMRSSSAITFEYSFWSNDTNLLEIKNTKKSKNKFNNNNHKFSGIRKQNTKGFKKQSFQRRVIR